MAADLRFFATTAKGMEPLLADELRGARRRRGRGAPRRRAASRGPLEVRLPRLPVVAGGQPRAAAAGDVPAPTTSSALRRRARRSTGPSTSTASARSPSTAPRRARAITHSHFAALKTKDAIVDQLRERARRAPVGRRGAARRARQRLSARTDAADGEPRPLRREPAPARLPHARRAGAAPLKENARRGDAAAGRLAGGRGARAALLDPMCGSGTLPIEAALMAGDIAPGLRPRRIRLPRLEAARRRRLGRRCVEEARERREAGIARLAAPAAPLIEGYDRDKRVDHPRAQERRQRAGLEAVVHVERRELSELAPPADRRPGRRAVGRRRVGDPDRTWS